MDGSAAGAVPAAAQGPWYLTTGQRIIGTVAGVGCFYIKKPSGCSREGAVSPGFLTINILQASYHNMGVLVAVVFGLIAAISIYPTCIIAGVLEMIGGLVMLSFEAPFLVASLHALGRLAAFWEHRSQWYKVILYAVWGVIPMFLCIGFSIIIASIAMIATAAFYGMAAIGRRGSAMPAGATAPAFQGEPYRDMDKSGLVESQMYNNQGGFR